MKQKLWIVFILIALLQPLTPQLAQATESNKVVLILMDNLTWSDIIEANDPDLNKVINKSSIGLLNNRTFKSLSRPRSALTAGSGIRADGAPTSFEEYNADEPYGNLKAADMYKLRTGKHAMNGQILELGIASIIKDNDNGLQDFTAGHLGELLRNAHKKTAVLGNSDTSMNYEQSSLNREAALIAMDTNGRVDLGDVGKDLIIQDPQYPFGIRTNYQKLAPMFADYYQEADFVVIDLGDTTRADFFAQSSTSERAKQFKLQAIKDGGKFIQHAINTTPADTTFIIAALSPPSATKNSLDGSLEQLTPIIAYGPDFKPGGLISNTTHQNGLVSTIDIAPTVLHILGVKQTEDMEGNPLVASNSSITPQQLNAFNLSALGMKDTRYNAIRAYIYIQLALYILTALVIVYKKILNRLTVTILETLIFTAMGFPLFSFYTSKLEHFASQSLVITLLTVLLSLVFAIVLVLTRRKELNPIASISAITIILLTLNALSGGSLFLNSIFGYDPIRGSRFFGIGNEAMSILIANTLLLCGIILDKSWTKRSIFLCFVLAAFIVTILGFPKIGAKTGGIIVSVASFSVMMLLAVGSKAKLRNALITFAAVGVVLAGFVTYDMLHGATTHMGKTINLIDSSGFQQIAIIAKRKLTMNLMLLRFSPWSSFLPIALSVLIFLWFKPEGVLRRLLANHPGISAAVTSTAIGGIVGFAFNDSGIVVPAIMASYIIPTVIYLMLWQKNQKARD